MTMPRGSGILARIMSALKSFKQWSAAFAIAALLAGCASNPAPVANYSFGGSSPPAPATTAAPAVASSSGVQTFGLGGHANGTMGASGYTVARGDTLYSIAFANGMDARQLAALNNIPPPYVIHPGQVLRLKPASHAVVAGGPAVAGNAAPPAAATAPPRPITQAQATQPSAPVFGPVTTQSMTGNGVAPAESGSAAAAPAASVAPAATAAAPRIVPPPAEVQTPSAQPAVPTPPPGATRSVGGITWQWPASGKVVGGFEAGGGGDGAGLNITGNMGDPVRAAASGTVVYSGNGLIGYGELIIIKHNDTFLSAYGHNSKRLVKEGDHVSAGQEIALMGASGAPRVELHFEIRKDGKPVDPLGYLPQR
ncbi:MAG TPA: peptidoglycan DD-metalloendopeptidase family protein [Rhodanobacteraceae bacterium]|nr:peptidoglycan DD-metalloendopeptidase family protein [Rhodanobacteraceae bacterium]